MRGRNSYTSMSEIPPPDPAPVLTIEEAAIYVANKATEWVEDSYSTSRVEALATATDRYLALTKGPKCQSCSIRRDDHAILPLENGNEIRVCGYFEAKK